MGNLIERFAGLHFDLAVPSPENIYAPSGAHDSTLYKDGQLAHDWHEILEKYPLRFVAASDYRPPIERMYPTTIRRQRKLILDVLSESARHQIAYQNAWRLVTGQAWA